MLATANRATRLTMGHLAIWVIGCAVGFGAYRSIMPRRAAPPRVMVLVSCYGLAMGTAFGTILTGCGLMAYRRQRGGEASGAPRPGHWLLWLGLGAAAANVAAIAAYQQRAALDPSLPSTPFLAQFEPGPQGFTPILHHHAVGWGMGAVVALGFLVAVRGHLEQHWVGVFLVVFLAAAALAIGHVTALVLSHFPVDTRTLNHALVHVYAGSVVLGALAIAAALERDRRAGTPADGLHRLGAGTWLAIAAIQMIVYACYLSW